MTSPRITYAPRHDTASKGELDALVAIYRRAIERFDTKKGGPETAPDDAEEFKYDRTDAASIHR